MNKKVEKFRDMSAEELSEQLKEFKAELFNLRFQQATGQLGNPMVIRDCRKNIARVSTLMRQQELAAGKEAQA